MMKTCTSRTHLQSSGIRATKRGEKGGKKRREGERISSGATPRFRCTSSAEEQNRYSSKNCVY